MMDNASAMSVFTLSAFSGTERYRIPLFVVTFLCYCVIWLVNLTIIVTIIVDKNLHEPIFLCNLCINGLYGTAGFYPKFLSDLLSSTHVISYVGCLLQGFVVHSSVSADFTLLALMALDRYVALCHPLKYHSVMTRQRMGMLLLCAWLIPHFALILSTVPTSMLTLCGSQIPKIYCINYLVGKLACTPSLSNVIVPAINYSFFAGHFLIVILSYIYLVRMCVKSKEGRSKFMKTCLPHLICLITYFVSLLFDLVFIRFGSKAVSQDLLNFMAIEFFIVPPIVNPLIYGLKLTKIRNKVAQFICSKKQKSIKP
uniref:G-protein coupled receptors family 1 profile domain-containing protein n=1 Tax=Neogobius melanostomus TaxID=47308 RepID=A0A8C6TX14_9GOBI